MRVSALLLGLLLLPAVAAGEETVLRFYGYAHDQRSGRYLFTEVHEQHVVDGRWTGGTTDFYLPDGRHFGRKTLRFGDDELVPVYRLDLPLEGYAEEIVSAGEVIQMRRTSASGRPPQSVRLARRAPVCADSGLHNLVRTHFAELMAGAELKFRLAVPGSLDDFRFRIRRIADTEFEGQPAVRFRAEANSFLRWIADPIELTYDTGQMKLLEYRGPSNVRAPDSGQQYHVRISYADQAPPDAPPLPPLARPQAEPPQVMP